jgi:hypothetical protein
MMYTLLYQDNQNRKNTISFDCIISASETYTSSVTEHPVESGAPISDHIQHKNVSIDIEGVVSDYNISNPSKGGVLVSFVDGVLEGDNSFPLSPTALIRDQLLFVRNNKLGCTILVGKSGTDTLLEYRNCVLTSLRFTDSAPNGDSVNVSMSFTPIRVATVRRQKEERVPIALLKATTPTEAKDGAATGTVDAAKAGQISTGKAPPAEGQIPKEIDDKARALQDEAANIREAVRRLEEKK